MADMISLTHGAIESGIPLFDTADFYGHSANEVLLDKVTSLTCQSFGILNFLPDENSKWFYP